jgi:hypothetical protein
MNKPLIPPSDPQARAMLQRMQAGGVVDVHIVTRIELRQAIAQALAQVNVTRGQFINIAAGLERLCGMVDLAADQLRAMSLGRVPAGVSEREIPGARDVADVRSVFGELTRLIKAMGEAASADPFEDGQPPPPINPASK